MRKHICNITQLICINIGGRDHISYIYLWGQCSNSSQTDIFTNKLKKKWVSTSMWTFSFCTMRIIFKSIYITVILSKNGHCNNNKMACVYSDQLWFILRHSFLPITHCFHLPRKSCSTSLAIRILQSKTTSYHFTP